MDDIFVDLHPVGGLDQRAVGQAELVLRGGDLVMVLVHRQAHFEHGRDHLAADVHRAVDRGDGEIAALGAGPVRKVAAVIFAAGVGRQLDVVDAEAARVVIVLEADVVEHEELGFGPDVDGVARAAGLEIGFGAGRGGARVAAVKLAGRRLDDVAEQDHHRGRRERIDVGGVEVGLEDHVGFVDRLPPGDRAAVEHQAVGQGIVVDHARGHGQMLPLALGIGEAEVDPVDLLVLDPRKDRARVGWLGHGLLPLTRSPA